jgi:excisionase family DNA binding protein
MRTATDLEPLLTVSDVAALCVVAPSTVYEWASNGRIPHLKIGGAIRFSRPTIERWLADSSRGPVVVVA